MALSLQEEENSRALSEAVRASKTLEREYEAGKQMGVWDKWTCLGCMKENGVEIAECTTCLSSFEQFGEIKCPECTFDNTSSATCCFMCKHSLMPSVLVTATKNASAKCGMPGCGKFATDFYGFCGSAHHEAAKGKQILPPSEEGVQAVFVGDTGEFTAHLLTTRHPKHPHVKQQFLDSWTKIERGHRKPRVERIYWLRTSPVILQAHQEVIKEQRARGFVNIERRFHGTKQSSDCFFGTDPSKPPCSSKQCTVCSICRNSFDMSYVRKGPGSKAWSNKLRYGSGLYFAPNSSKSNDYNEASERSQRAGGSSYRNWRCMFLCNVAIGNAYETQDEMLPEDRCPPPGYDSVVGRVGPHLNYDEVVIYKQEQAIPSYLVVYSLDT